MRRKALRRKAFWLGLAQTARVGTRARDAGISPRTGENDEREKQDNRQKGRVPIDASGVPPSKSLPREGMRREEREESTEEDGESGPEGAQAPPRHPQRPAQRPNTRHVRSDRTGRSVPSSRSNRRTRSPSLRARKGGARATSALRHPSQYLARRYFASAFTYSENAPPSFSTASSVIARCRSEVASTSEPMLPENLWTRYDTPATSRRVTLSSVGAGRSLPSSRARFGEHRGKTEARARKTMPAKLRNDQHETHNLCCE